MISERLLTIVMRFELSRLMKFVPQGKELPQPKPGRKYLLYVHVPFCERLCPYCSFNRFVFREEKTRRYFKSLRKEMQMVADMGFDFSSMYIGGGTPTVLIDELTQTIDLAKSLFSIEEVSCETNPNHLTHTHLEELQGRVDRLSVGMQSFDNNLLKQMNRLEKYGSGEENLKRFQEIHHLFPTFNVDMIFNFPGQTKEILKRDIEYLLESGVNQTTYYALMTSPLVEKSMVNSVGKVNYQREADLYSLIDAQLTREFTPISAWCFSRNGNQLIDEYIVDHQEYIGIGSGSFSYLDGSLFVNTFSLREYDEKIAAGNLSIARTKRFSRNDQMRYRFMMDLFGLKLDKANFKQQFGISVERGLPIETTYLRAVGAFDNRHKDSLVLTPKGRYLLVAMMREFFSSMDRVREQAREGLSETEKHELLEPVCSITPPGTISNK